MCPAPNLMNEECLWSWGSLRLIGGVPETEGVQNGVSSDVYEGEIQVKKSKEEEDKKKEGKRKKMREEKKRKNEEKEKEERFSRSGWEWYLSF